MSVLRKNSDKARLNGKFFQVITIALLTIFFQPIILQAKKDERNVVTLKARNQTFNEIANQLSKKLECTIVFDESLANCPISGNFQNIELDEFLYRALRNKNISVITDSLNDTVYVRNFGNKNGHMLYTSNLPSFSQNNAITRFFDKPFSELHSIAAVQEKNRIERITGNGSFSPMTALYNKYNRMVSVQEKNRTNRLKQLSYIFPNTDASLGEILRDIDTQETKRIDRLNSKDAINPTTGLNQFEVLKFAAAQENNREERIRSDVEMLPTMGTISYSRLSQIVKQQELNRKKRLGI